MKNAISAVLVFSGLLAGGRGYAQLRPIYLFPATNAEVVIQIGSDRQVHDCGGPTVVQTAVPLAHTPPDTIPIEILSLSLTCSQNTTIVRDPDLPLLVGQTNTTTGDSSVPVAVKITKGTLNLRGVVIMKATIAKIPPHGAKYFSQQPVTLTGADNATLVSVRHELGFPPESMGEFSTVFSCFYECKPLRTRAWQELTTLMLVNQSLRPIEARILFVDGKQSIIAKTVASLSPLDLDEINVCATIQNAGVPVPPLGSLKRSFFPPEAFMGG